MVFFNLLLYHVAEVPAEISMDGLHFGLCGRLFSLREAVCPAQVRMWPVCPPRAPCGNANFPNSSAETEQI